MINKMFFLDITNFGKLESNYLSILHKVSKTEDRRGTANYLYVLIK